MWTSRNFHLTSTHRCSLQTSIIFPLGHNLCGHSVFSKIACSVILSISAQSGYILPITSEIQTTKTMLFFGHLKEAIEFRGCRPGFKPQCLYLLHDLGEGTLTLIMFPHLQNGVKDA